MERGLNVELGKKGNLIIISGPSGVGKGTLVKKILKDLDDVILSVSATTRKPRNGEKNGKHYYFITEDNFLEIVKNDGFLEYARYNSNYYGTPKSNIENMINNGKNVILEIDVQGAIEIKNKFKRSITIFIMPPCINDLYERLRGRNTETSEEIEKRIARAKQEISLAEQYDYIVVNDSMVDAEEKIKDIILSCS